MGPGPGPHQRSGPDDVRKLAEFLAAIPGISASPIDIKARPSGIAQGYMTVNLERR